MSNVNFKLISAFMSVASHASFRKAAEEMHRSLPAVSMQIRQLEDQLGVALFQRTTRKVELTQLGEQLMISARRAMAELDHGLSEIQHAADVQQGHLSFACVPTVASTRLPVILTAFAHQYPGVTVHVRELVNKELVECVRRREVDFGIGPTIEKSGELQFDPIFHDDYCALLPRNYRDGGRSSISLAELSRMPLLKLSTSTSFRGHVDQVLEAQGLSTESSYEFQQVSTLVAMAEAGLGVALLPRISVPAETSLKMVRVSRPVLSRTIAIVSIRGHSLSPAAGRFVALCKALIAGK